MSYQTHVITFQEKGRLQVRFPGFVPQLAKKMKQIPGAFWKPDYGWLLPDTDQRRALLEDLFSSQPLVSGESPAVGAPTPSQLESHETALLKLTEQLMLNRYSYATVKSYRSCFGEFLADPNFSTLAPDEISKDQIKAYFLRKIKQKKWSESTQNQA